MQEFIDLEMDAYRNNVIRVSFWPSAWHCFCLPSCLIQEGDRDPCFDPACLSLQNCCICKTCEISLIDADACAVSCISTVHGDQKPLFTSSMSLSPERAVNCDPQKAWFACADACAAEWISAVRGLHFQCGQHYGHEPWAMRQTACPAQTPSRMARSSRIRSSSQ